MRNGSFFCFERKLVSKDYVIFLIFFMKSMKKSNAQTLAQFSHLFQETADSRLGYVEVNC